MSLADRGRSDAFTYEPVGALLSGDAPDGYHHVREVRPIGTGDAVFESARAALAAWQVQRRSGLSVWADGPPAVGRVVAMSAPLPVTGHIDAVCRVVQVVDEPDRSGFTYGTLSVHPESGEESFVIERHVDGSVRFVVEAVSRPRMVLARLVPPITSFIQRRATARYLDTMEALASP